jgi:DNA-binding GntR family transcriptional regulator
MCCSVLWAFSILGADMPAIFDFSKLSPDQTEFVKELALLGESAVMANTHSDLWGESKRPVAIAWLALQERQRELEAHAQIVQAAKDSSEAAKATCATAKYTLWIAVGTFIAAVATCFAAFGH